MSEPTTDRLAVPERQGPRPVTDRRLPHSQISQTSPLDLQEELCNRVSALPGITIDRSLVSVPDARAFHLDAALATGPVEAFQARTEFGHLHPAHDGSLHLTLPPDVAKLAQENGWTEPHPVGPGVFMVYGPRNQEELELVWDLVQISYRWARGESSHAVS